MSITSMSSLNVQFNVFHEAEMSERKHGYKDIRKCLFIAKHFDDILKQICFRFKTMHGR